VGWVGYAAVHRANLSALGGLEPADTLSALIGVNDIDCFRFLNRLILAVWLTSSATNALLSNLICHPKHLLLCFRLG